MTQSTPSDYREASARSLRDTPSVRTSVGSATRTFDAHRVSAFSEVEYDRWKDWARDTKTHALTHLDTYLAQASAQLGSPGRARSTGQRPRRTPSRFWTKSSNVTGSSLR